MDSANDEFLNETYILKQEILGKEAFATVFSVIIKRLMRKWQSNLNRKFKS